MIDQLKTIIEQVSAQAGGSVIPSNLTKEVTQETGNSILSGIKDAVSSGDFSQVTNLFESGTSNLASNPMVSGMITNLVGSLSGKLGLDSATSSGIANSIIPKVLEVLVSKTKDGSFDLKDLMGSSSSEGLGGMLGGLAGSLLNKGQDKQGGGALDALKGMFK